MGRLSVRRLVSSALIVSYASLLPLLGVVYFRLYQIKASPLAAGRQAHADFALRDVTVFVLIWMVLALVLWVSLRRAVVRPVHQLERILVRIAQGDDDAELPATGHGALPRLARAIERALEETRRRDQLKTARIIEQRNVIRRVIDALDVPVIIVGVDHTLDYANEAAASVLGQQVGRLEGAELGRVPSGDQIRALMDRVLGLGELRSESADHALGCYLVRDARGEASRVVMVLRDARGEDKADADAAGITSWSGFWKRTERFFT